MVVNQAFAEEEEVAEAGRATGRPPVIIVRDEARILSEGAGQWERMKEHVLTVGVADAD